MTEACEGCYLYAYDDKGELDDNGRPTPFEEGDDLVGTLTIGHGHTGPDVVPGMRITQEQADALYLEDVKEAEDGVKSCVTVPLKQSEFDACCDQVFNTGIGKFAKPSTMLTRLNDGDYDGAGEAILMWYKTKGLEYGMLRRCAARYALFMGLPWDAAYKHVTRAMTGNMLGGILTLSAAAADLLAVAKRQRDSETKAFATAMKKESAPKKEAPPVKPVVSGGPTTETKRIVVEKIEEVKQPEEKPVATPTPKKIYAPPDLSASMANLPYGQVEVTSKPKDMLKSRRFWGLLVMIVSRTAIFGTTLQFGAGHLMQDAALLGEVTTAFAYGASTAGDVVGQWLNKVGKDGAKGFLK